MQSAIERRQREWAGACHCDYAFHTMVQGKIAPEILPQLKEAVEAGDWEAVEIDKVRLPVN